MSTGTQRGLSTVKYLIDNSASRFSVQAFATGMLSVFGHNPTIGVNRFAGEVQYAPETYEDFSLRITFQTGELEVLDEMKKDDRKKLEQLMYGEVLKPTVFPEAVYESKKAVVEKFSPDVVLAHVSGELSFHGVKQSQPVDARVNDMGDRLRISGEFALQQSAYGIRPVSFAGGALRLKDELKFKFEFIAKKQP